jgi:hypothetical protein
MRWDPGRAVIERMISAREIERVPASRDFADELIESAREQLASAALPQNDPATAYDALYSAARKALTAVLENQGLRATIRGGHLAVYEAVRAQLDPPMGKVIRPFDRIRRQRHAVDYPSADVARVTTADVRADIPVATAITDLAERVLDEMSPF